MTLEEKIKNAQYALNLEKDTLKAIFEQSVMKPEDALEYFDPDSYVIGTLQGALEEINTNIKEASKSGYCEIEATLQYIGSDINLDYENLADTIAEGLRGVSYKVKYEYTEDEKDEDTGRCIYTMTFDISWNPISNTSVNVYKEPLYKGAEGLKESEYKDGYKYQDKDAEKVKEEINNIFGHSKKNDIIDPLEKYKKYKEEISKYKEELTKKLKDSNIEDELYKTLVDTTCKGFEMSKELLDELITVFKK